MFMLIGAGAIEVDCEDEMRFTTESNQYSEPVLVSKATKGDLDAFNQLVLKYQHLAFNHAYMLLRDQDLAEDAAQDGFIKAFQNMTGFRGGSFRAWLLKIVTNVSYDLMRRSRRHPMQPLFPKDQNGEEVESPIWLVDPAASIEATVEQREHSTRLCQLLDELPHVYRTVITLIDINELDYAEVAQILKIPIGTVKSRLARARFKVMGGLQNSSEFSRKSGSMAEA